MSGADTARVELLGLPLDVHRRASEHGETLRRELAFIRHSISADSAPARLRSLGEELAPRYRGLDASPHELLAKALAADAATVDLAYEVPVGAAGDFERILALLEELDRFCIDRDLLTLVTPPEGVAYRSWWIGEFIEQLRDGRPPRPWRDVPHALDEPAAAPALDAAADTATIKVHGDLDLERAPALRAELVQHIEEGATRLAVDLADCGFMDSTGLSLLLTTHLRLEAEGGSLVLMNVPRQVAAVLELSGVEGLLT